MTDKLVLVTGATGHLGFKVLRTTRDISILLAVIQVLTVALLGLILLGIVALLYCVNPDLEVRFLHLLPLSLSW